MTSYVPVFAFGGMCLMACVLFMFAAPAAGQEFVAERAGPWPKVILFGSVIDPQEMLADPERLKKLPFEGYILHGDANDRPLSQDLAIARTVLGPRRMKFENYERLVNDMRKMRQFAPHVTECFIQVSPLPGTLENRPDNNAFPEHDRDVIMWFSDDFDIVLHNMRIAARVARESGARGIMHDVEPYGGQLWRPERLKLAGEQGKTFEQIWRQVRMRGEQVMQAMQSQYPDMTLMLIVGHERARPDSETYRLTGAYLDGLFAAAGPDVRIVNGFENYRLASRNDFLEAYWFTHCWSRQRCAVPDKYAQKISAGFPVWPEVDGWDKTNPTAKFPPDRYERVLTNALSVADHYVWVYSEGAGNKKYGSWWTGEALPDAYIDATRRAMAAARPPIKSEHIKGMLGKSVHPRRITYQQWFQDYVERATQD